MKNIILAILLGMLLVGCGNENINATTDLREYTISMLEKGPADFVVVGVGKFSADSKTFLISSFNGQEWEVPASMKIEESKVTLGSFKRITRDKDAFYE